MSPFSRRGISLVEVIVVVAAIAILAGLLLPAVQMARESARRTTCTNRQREIAQAALGYLQAKGHFPGSVNMLGYRKVDVNWQTGKPNGVALATPRPTPGSWVVPLLPHLARNDIYTLHATSQGGALTGIPVDSHVETLVCPSDFQAAAISSFSPQTQNSYAANCGQIDVADGLLVTGQPPDPPGHGVFHNHFAFNHRTGVKKHFRVVEIGDSFLQRADGAGATILLSENVDSGNWGEAVRIESSVGLLWWPTVETIDGQPRAVPPTTTDGVPVAGINQALGTIDQVSIEDTHSRNLYARPSSFHAGGVTAAFCDGHVRWLNDDLDYLVYCLLMTPDGSRATSLDRDIPAHEIFRRTPLPADALK